MLGRSNTLTIMVILLACLSAMVTVPSTAQTDALAEGFANPPQIARPRVWWHWMNGNISKEGIRLDFEWMKHVGLGGIQNFDANLATPQLVERRLSFMSPEWRNAFHYAASLADTMGLEMAIASSPGWSETGGPWVKPEQAMKKFVWSETLVVEGEKWPRPAAPPNVAGPFQTISTGGSESAKLNYYVDTKTVAYRLPVDALSDVSAERPTVTASASVDIEALNDGDIAKLISLPYGAGKKAWIRFDYRTKQRIQSVSVAMPGGRTFGAPPASRVWLEASDGAAVFRRVVELPASSAQTRVATFAPLEASAFRIVFEAVPGMRLGEELGAPGAIGMPFEPIPESFEVSEVTLYRQARVHGFDEKAGFGAAMDYYAISTPTVGRSSVVPKSDVVDLTSKLRPDGRVDWTVPVGKWVILRFGYTLTGHTNGPASPEATGLEVDKLNPDHVRSYLNHYLDMYADAAGHGLLGSRGVTALLNDSIESGPQNWTENMLSDFKRLRGYDLTPWMPVLTGVIVDSAAASDRVLWDYRRTIAELLTESHYHTVAKIAQERGLKLYGEAIENRRPQLGDDIAMRKYTTIPMAAMWVNPPDAPPRANYWADDVGAASVAHVYGQNLAAAESLTSSTMPWFHTPRDLKATADLEFALGINRIVIHTSVHQPLVDKRPGLALAVQLGQYFNRNETWAGMADGWVSYLSRSSYLLQQGRYAADLAYFIGEEAPLTAQFAAGPPADMPTHFGVDFVNSDILQNVLTVRRGLLVTPSGMSYRALYLGGSSRMMTLGTLKRIAELVRAGAVVIGERPVDSPSESDDRMAFQRLVSNLWSGATQTGGARVGAGRIVAGRTPEEAMRGLGVTRDFDYGDHRDILTLHRKLADGDIYYVHSTSNQPMDVEATFRVSALVPEIWRADTGERAPTGYTQDGETTHIKLNLAPRDALFVVFHGKTAEREQPYYSYQERVIGEISGQWNLSFEAGRGAPEQLLTLRSLDLWNESADPRIRYFSGIGTYRTTVQAPASAMRPGARVLLDLGNVNDLAEVWLNNKRIAVAWHAPYRVDLSGALHAGGNELEIRVANRWVNRLIGDAQPGAVKISVTQGPAYEATAPLTASGLAGPVRLLEVVPQSPK